MTTTRTQALERELKFDAPLGAGLPDLRDLVGRTERLQRQMLQTVYFDTVDGRLWEAGMTLRHRIGETASIGTWTLKLPASVEESALERTEVSWPGEREHAPQEALDILRGLIRNEPVQQRVQLDTTRQRLALHDGADNVIAEIDDDDVTVAGGPRDGLRFRQVEMELHGDRAKLHRKIALRLEKSGLSLMNTQKLPRAMGLTDHSATGSQLCRESPVSDVVRAVISQGLARLLERDWRLRIAAHQVDPEDVHQARVAVRRLRSDLKTFQVVLDPVWVKHVRGDLKWLGSLLGNVRDADVLAKKFEGAPKELNERLASQRIAASKWILTTLATRRYLLLLDRLHAAMGAPPFLIVKGSIHPDDAAIDVLPALVGARWHSLCHQVQKAGTQRSDTLLHRVRIKSKQLRYASEAAAPVIGKPAIRTARTAEKMQATLGDHHDAVTAESWLRTQAEIGLSSLAAFEAGRMAARQHRQQHRLRHRWQSQWAALAGSNRQDWMN